MTSSSEFAQAAARSLAAGDTTAAIAAYRAALALEHSNPALHHNLGAAFALAGDYASAAASFLEASRLRPTWIEPWLALGHLHFKQAQYPQAQTAFEQAIALGPDHLGALFNLGVTLNRRKRWRLALPLFERARKLSLDNEAIWYQLRANLLLLGETERALEDFLAYESIAAPTAHLVQAGLASCRLMGSAGQEQKYLMLALHWNWQPTHAPLVAEVLMLLQYFDVEPAQILRMYQIYNRLQQANRGDAGPLAAAQGFSVAASPSPVLRVGYLSADFRYHVMGRLLVDIIAGHDPARFSVHLYSLAPPENEDEVTQDFRRHAARFVQLADIDDLTAAQAIAADKLDILVDLMGHSSFSRPGILLYKPAPVIATHLGYHGALGLEQVDYKLTDEIADAGDNQRYLPERLLPMDRCVLPMRRNPARDLAQETLPPLLTIEGSPVDSSADGKIFVFGEFVSAYKLSPRCLALWLRILERLPQARLAFSPWREADRMAIVRQVTGYGIPAQRLLFIPHAKGDDAASARYRCIGAVLDTLPYSGGDTTMAALDAGIPVVTLTGKRQAERMTTSILTDLGITSTIASSEDEYVELACRLATDTAFRKQVSEMISAKLTDTDFADSAAYTRSLERALVVAASAPKNPPLF